MQAWYIYIYKKDGFQISISLKRGIRKDTNTMKRSNCLGFFWWRIFEVHAQEKEGAVSILIWVQTKHEWGVTNPKSYFCSPLTSFHSPSSPSRPEAKPYLLYLVTQLLSPYVHVYICICFRFPYIFRSSPCSSSSISLISRHITN